MAKFTPNFDFFMGTRSCTPLMLKIEPLIEAFKKDPNILTDPKNGAERWVFPTDEDISSTALCYRLIRIEVEKITQTAEAKNNFLRCYDGSISVIFGLSRKKDGNSAGIEHYRSNGDMLKEAYFSIDKLKLLSRISRSLNDLGFYDLKNGLFTFIFRELQNSKLYDNMKEPWFRMLLPILCSEVNFEYSNHTMPIPDSLKLSDASSGPVVDNKKTFGNASSSSYSSSSSSRQQSSSSSSSDKKNYVYCNCKGKPEAYNGVCATGQYKGKAFYSCKHPRESPENCKFWFLKEWYDNARGNVKRPLRCDVHDEPLIQTICMSSGENKGKKVAYCPLDEKDHCGVAIFLEDAKNTGSSSYSNDRYDNKRPRTNAYSSTSSSSNRGYNNRQNSYR